MGRWREQEALYTKRMCTETFILVNNALFRIMAVTVIGGNAGIIKENIYMPAAK